MVQQMGTNVTPSHGASSLTSMVTEYHYEMHDAKGRNSHRQQKNLDGIALGLPVFLGDSQNDQNKSTPMMVMVVT